MKAKGGSVPPASRATFLDGPNALHGLTVLVVDDEADAREVLSFVLLTRGARVEEACGSEAALAYLAMHTPDVVISDIAMPGEDGYTFIQRVRALQNDGKRAIPAIALTAFTRDMDRERAMQAGFDVHLPKPMPVSRVIRAVFELSQTSDEAPRREGPEGAAERLHAKRQVPRPRRLD
jgi:CheY-like chemotaxis protein